MDKVYNHKIYEEKIYKLWEKSLAFTPKIDKKKKPFCIIMPPPNANDPLHIGHARFVAIQDILIRYNRMKKNPTLWLPGSDHAGIETQYVFEKKLKKIGKSRFDFDRDTFFKMIWDYSQENKKVMEEQLKKLGASCDWTRNKFTLDPEIVKVVYKTFKKLYEDGLIYRGERIVNYCPRCGTAFSQLEVDYVEKDDFLYFVKYGGLTIATTRPETMFADVAVSVNPKDKRYQKFVGKKVILPIVNRELPVISDTLVDPSFGTGVLKITPGHDPLDFEIGKKHNLPIISVIDKDGKMINTPPKYIGLKVEEAREEVVKDLQKKGLIEKIETIYHNVGTCYRDKGIIEPIVSKQWFLKVNSLVKLALNAIKEKKVTFVSKRFEKIARHWLKNLRDWNLSRQIVWGIRIPAWRCNNCLEWIVTDGSQPTKCPSCNNNNLIQDNDTFDTWFSSAQWPFATLLTSGRKEYPSKDKTKLNIDINPTADFLYFYPSSLMETGYDILPFWVIRMIMLGIYTTGEIPFKKVLLHGLVRDERGEKISKSKGNVIDPIEMAEKYGADSLRMGLVWSSLLENDISLSENNIVGQRNFSNKIWNVARYIFMTKPEKSCGYKKAPSSKNNEDKKIVKELKRTTKEVTKLIENYRLNEAAKILYNFFWYKFANDYLEKTKKRRAEAQKTLEFILQQSLKLLHPFMPFVTEAVWQEGKNRFDSPLLINSVWPK